VDVIACHIEADFDALASMLAARHLYPEARLVFPGAQERVVRAFVAEGYVPDLPVVSVREIEIGAIRRLILVDTRRADRVGALGPVAARPDVELHVYDHHPPVHDDLHGRVDVSRPVGANTTLMLGVLRERGIIIGPEEATLCLLGIYHETGCLTYEGTTPEDCEAAARLLRAGADLGIVARFLPGDLDAAQIALLDELLQGAAHIDVHGADVVLTQASTERHVVGLGEIASRAAGILGARAFFALVRMTDRVFVAGRSRDPAVNSGRIATALGGGGHAAAAAATVKDRTLIEVREALMEALRANVIPAQRARDCMTPEPQTVDPQTPMVEIAGILERRHFDTLPVVKGERLVGLISRQTVERAVHHGLGDSPVEPYMATEFTALTPEAAVEEIERVMVAHHQRLVPILRGGGLVGVVTRQNLLGLAEEAEAGEEIFPMPPGGREGAAQGERRRRKSLRKLMADRLPAPVLDLLRSLGETAAAEGMRGFVVGGFVRDLLLGRPNYDLDLVIEGDGIALARIFAARAGGRARTHEMFGTAGIVLQDRPDLPGGDGGFRIDVATARCERYERPGALPAVERSSLQRDLHRRDFSINTLAIRLEPEGFGELIDFFGGQRDLKDRQIRVLHALSFVEDPTRAFRALRFEQRFNFRIGKFTERLLRTAARHLHGVSGGRILNELIQILEEAEVTAILRRLDRHGLLAALEPSLALDEACEGRLARAVEMRSWFRLLYTGDRIVAWLPAWLALTSVLEEEASSRLASRLGIKGSPADRIATSRRGARTALRALAPLDRGDDLPPSAIAAALRAIPLEGLLWLMALAEGEGVRRAVSRYLTAWRSVGPQLSPRDLMALGVPEGPAIGKALRDLRDARLDGEAGTREEEKARVRAGLRSGKFR
jgi:tRNA nucleotidyltransferase (CCA-adding enzyme)